MAHLRDSSGTARVWARAGQGRAVQGLAGVMGRRGGQVEGVDTLQSSKKPLKEQPGLIRFVISAMWVMDYSGAQWEVGRQVGGIWTEQVKGEEGARA